MPSFARSFTRLVCFSTCWSLINCRSQADHGVDPSQLITVLRVASSAPEQPAAEHCEEKGQPCVPLAASQRIAARGWVRTFAGGTISLDFGQGRRVDLDSLSQLQLERHTAKLQRGQFSVDSIPLITQDTPDSRAAEPLRVSVGNKTFEPDVTRPTTTLVRVAEQDAWLTVRRGQLRGPDQDSTAQTGQSLRLTQARAFRTGSDGSELPQLLPVAPRSFELGTWQEHQPAQEARGLGTMSARLPGTAQQREGVRLLKHHAQVHIIDGYAYTQIEEEFENTTPHILEGQYRFVVPSDAALSRLGLWVGDQLMEGEVLERGRAKEIYTSIVDQPVPRDPALLEWENGGTMSLKVFPILPQKTRRVLVAYQQTLSAEGGLLRYVHPLSLGRARGTEIEDFSIEIFARDRHANLGPATVRHHEAALSTRDDQPQVRFSAAHFIPQQDFEVTFPRIERSDAQLSSYVTKWAQDEKAYGQLSTPLPPGAQCKPAPSSSPSAQEGYFGLRFRVDLPEDSPRPNYTALSRAIVLDTSHSQSKETIAAQAELAFGLLLEMDPEESFVLLSCDSACESWSSRSLPTQPVHAATPALPQRLAAARAFLQRLKPGGASDIAGAMVAAAAQLEHLDQEQSHTRQLVYLGDGRPSAGELSALSIKTRVGPYLQRSRAELRVIGVGHALDQDILRGLAIELGATFDLLKSGVALEQRVWELSSALRRPVLKDARLQLPPGLVAVESHALPALRLGQEVLVTGEIVELRDGDITLTGTLDGRPYRLSKALRWSAPSQGTATPQQNPMIPKLWAKNRIALLQSLDPSPQTIAQIIDLSTRYRIMSRYTSFLVLENDAMYEDFGIARPEREKSKDESESFVEQVSPTRGETELGRTQRYTESEPPPAPVAQEAPSAAPKSSAASNARSSGSHAAPRSPSGDVTPEGASIARERREAEAEAPQRKAAAADRDYLAPPPEENSTATSPPYGHFRERPRFRLHARVMDDAWRSWDAERLANLEQSLNADAHSRARNEAWIRGLLTTGRFVQAQQAADRFFHLDPDSPVAAQLLAFSSVVAEDREKARLMLDVQTEQRPDDVSLHLQAARAFSVAGDDVRACAHRRSAAALDKHNESALKDADRCWQDIAQLHPSPSSWTFSKGEAGAMQVRVECSAKTPGLDCPAPIVINPFGEVFSPWTPGLGNTDRSQVTLLRLRTGTYFVLVAGGAPGANGQLKIDGKGSQFALPFSGGALHTTARIDVSYD